MEELLASFNAQAKAPDIHFLSLRASMEELSASFNAQDQAPDDSHAQDHPCAPCIFVENPRHCGQVLARLHTKQDIPHLSLLIVSPDSAQQLFERILLPYLGGSRIEFQLCCLRIRFVSQGGVCFHSVDLGCSWTLTVIIFNDPRGSTLFVSIYISFA